MTTSYDQVAYPTTLHVRTHPERLAIAARLAGLEPAPMDEARVLEIGGGSCFGLIAFASTFPGSRCVGFDLAESAVAHGRKLAGGDCPNLTLEVADIMEAAGRYAAGSFDYVIAHGVYAWVPEPVRAALLALIKHVLSPRGIGFVSYNAMPGGHVRMILREMVLHAIAGIEDRGERIATAYEVLRQFAEPQDDDAPMLTGLRRAAAAMATRPAAVVFHDEMGEVFAPQSLDQFVRAAARAGLRFLTDAGRNRGFDGFLTADAGAVVDPDGEVLRLAQMRDYRELCYFRATLLVHPEAPLDRRIDPARLDGLWISAQLEVLGDGEFRSGEDVIAVADPELAARLADLAVAFPARRPVGDIARTPEQRDTVLALYRGWFATLHLAPEPFVLVPGALPRTSPWIRSMLARGEQDIVTRDYRMMRIGQPSLRALLIAADGTRSVDALAAMDHGIAADQVPDALREAARRGLLVG